jgi:CHAT domain-containing protein
MSSTVHTFRNKFFGLTARRCLVLLSLVLAIPAVLVMFLRLTISQSEDPERLIAEADHFAWLSNWQRAGGLYVRAEHLAIKRGDKRDQLYAACGRLRSNIGLESISGTSLALTKILQNPIAQGDPRLRIHCLAIKGDIEREDRPDSADRDWQEVLELARGLGDKSWESRARAEMAVIEFMGGNTARARNLLTSALTSALARADLPTLVFCGSEVGNGLIEMGRAGEALDYCDTALHIASLVKGIGFPYPAYACKARALALLGRPVEGRKVLESTLIQTRQLNMTLEQTQVLILLGQVTAATGDRGTAIKYLENAGSLSRANGFLHSTAWSMYEAAKVYRDEGRYQDAERCEIQAMNAMRQVEDEYHLPLHLAMLADLKAKEGDLLKAQELFDQAEEDTETMIANSPNEEIKSSLIGTMSDVYKGDFAVATKLGHTPDAFRIVETARGRSISDLMSRPRPLEVELSDAQKAAEANVNTLQRTLLETSDHTARKELLDKLFLAEQLMGVQIQPANAIQDATAGSEPVNLKKLQTVLIPDEVVLEYVLADPASFCLVVNQKQAVIITLPTGGGKIAKLTARYLHEIEAGKYDKNDARELYDFLLAPLPELAQTSRLTIVPDETLWGLPIETLRGHNGKYVLQSHTISYVPSCTVLYYLRTLPHEVEPRMAFLGVGAVPYDIEPKDIEMDRGIMRAVSRGIYDISGVHLYRLPASRQEVISAEQALNHPKQSVLLLGADATESKFKSEPLDNFKILHFAVHALSTPQIPDRAALILGRDPNSSDDGLLQLREITQLSLSADLVTLSACSTATGELEGEEGIDGLAEAFLLAGAKSVVGALWNVDDSATETLMKSFYIHLAKGEDKASALRHAKLDYLQSLGDQPPAYWAAFTLVGDGSEPIIF